MNNIFQILESTPYIYSVKVLAIAFTILFFVYYFSGEGKDERGRAILAKSCVRGILVFFVLMNLCSQFTYSITENAYVFTGAITTTYDLTLLMILLNILILRRIE